MFVFKPQLRHQKKLQKLNMVIVSISALTLSGMEGHLCPSLVKDWKDIYVPLLPHHDGIIMLSFRASCTRWCNKNYYVVVRGP